MKIGFAVAAVAGAFLAIRLFHLLDGPEDVQLFALYLAFTACFYVGAALADGKQPWFSLEIGISIPVFVCSWLGLWHTPLWIAVGYTIHGVWDLFHHPRWIPTRTVRWFPPVCAVFDFAVALYLVVRFPPVF